jgi:TIR domain-containing protein
MNMKRVFVSYRHEKPDEELAKYLADHLKSHSYDVFIDADIIIGQDWIKEIETALLQSDFLIVLLSKNSIASDMVRHEVNLAHKHGKYTHGSLKFYCASENWKPLYIAVTLSNQT